MSSNKTLLIQITLPEDYSEIHPELALVDMRIDPVWQPEIVGVEGKPTESELRALADLDEVRAECERLQAWKAESIAVENEWDAQAIAKMLGGKLGASCRRVIAEKVPQLITEVERLRARLARRESVETMTVDEIARLCPPRLSTIGELRGWVAGYAAGRASMREAQRIADEEGGTPCG